MKNYTFYWRIQKNIKIWKRKKDYTKNVYYLGKKEKELLLFEYPPTPFLLNNEIFEETKTKNNIVFP